MFVVVSLWLSFTFRVLSLGFESPAKAGCPLRYHLGFEVCVRELKVAVGESKVTVGELEVAFGELKVTKR